MKVFDRLARASSFTHAGHTESLAEEGRVPVGGVHVFERRGAAVSLPPAPPEEPSAERRASPASIPVRAFVSVAAVAAGRFDSSIPRRAAAAAAGFAHVRAPRLVDPRRHHRPRRQEALEQVHAPHRQRDRRGHRHLHEPPRLVRVVAELDVPRVGRVVVGRGLGSGGFASDGGADADDFPHAGLDGFDHRPGWEVGRCEGDWVVIGYLSMEWGLLIKTHRTHAPGSWWRNTAQTHDARWCRPVRFLLAMCTTFSRCMSACRVTTMRTVAKVGARK